MPLHPSAHCRCRLTAAAVAATPAPPANRRHRSGAVGAAVNACAAAPPRLARQPAGAPCVYQFGPLDIADIPPHTFRAQPYGKPMAEGL